MNKQHVLDEIVRTTQANEGVPLGISAFTRVTGIQRYDWYGKFWAKWSDALVEAGFAPNQLTSAYTEQFLIEKIVPVIEKLKRFPANGDLRLLAHNEKDFPNPKTFQRFGSKKQFAIKILEYCKGRVGLDDTISVCNKVIESPEKQSVTLVNEAGTAPITGFVYLLKSGRNYKIGKTNAVGRRERELVIQLPEQANMIHEIPTDDPGGIEAYWHKRFANQRKNGEWFGLSMEDVRAFKRRKYM